MKPVEIMHRSGRYTSFVTVDQEELDTDELGEEPGARLRYEWQRDGGPRSLPQYLHLESPQAIRGVIAALQSRLAEIEKMGKEREG
jgi:hypothetical protein